MAVVFGFKADYSVLKGNLISSLRKLRNSSLTADMVQLFEKELLDAYRSKVGRLREVCKDFYIPV